MCNAVGLTGSGQHGATLGCFLPRDEAGRPKTLLYVTFPQLLVLLYIFLLCALEGRHYQAAGATMQRQ